MGDPRTNGWGRRDNSYGHTSRNKDHKDKYEPSSFFNKIALKSYLGIFISLTFEICRVLGLNICI